MSLYLGLSFGYHDSAAALVQDGVLVAASEEERFSRRKNDHAFPSQAIAFCLQQAGVAATQLDGVVYYENWRRKLDRIIKSGYRVPIAGTPFLEQSLPVWIADRKFDPLATIAQELGIRRNRVRFVEHHQSHAAAAYYPSPFDKAAVVTIDGVGEYETMTLSLGAGNKLEKRVSQTLPHSLGLLYSALTAYLGFKVNEDEYKVMGMAGYGRPTYADALRTLVRFGENGAFFIDQRCFEFVAPTRRSYNPHLETLLGPARRPDNPFNPERDDSDDMRRYADIAASLQTVSEEILLHVAKAALQLAGVPHLCLGGGVALNSLANNRLQKELGCQLFVHPAAGDAGGAVGAALHGAYANAKARLPRAENLSPYLGASYDQNDIRDALATARHCRTETFADTDALMAAVCRILLENKVVGWFQDRFEWGPRALGNRSILANPAASDMQEIINRKIKFREPFRPFAPVVLPERAHEFFDMPPDVPEWGPESFMLSIKEVRPPFRDKLPAITHVDGTARVQLARRSWNPKLCALLECFATASGFPILLNTSFNLKGEPIVNTPKQALMTFSWSDMDALVLGNTIVRKLP